MTRIKKQRGPEPERVKIKGDWKKAVAKALRKTIPAKPTKPPKA